MAQAPDSSSSSSGSLCVIQIGNPKDGSWRRVVRAHAARARHARRREAQGSLRLRAVRGDQLQMVPHHPQPSLRPTGIDPFNTLPRPTTRLESYLMNHYLNCVLAEASSSIYTDRAEYVRMGMRQFVIEVALTDKRVMDSIFMSCCRSLTAKQVPGPYLEHGLLYKASSIRTVMSAISDNTQPPGCAATTVALALASDSLAMNDIPATRSHCAAVGIMIHLNGGPGASEGNAFVAQVVGWINTGLDLGEEDSLSTAMFRCY